MTPIATRRYAGAVTNQLRQLVDQLTALGGEQETDNLTLELGLMSHSRYLRRWARRQQQRINLETKAFWLRIKLEELQHQLETE
jgi:hypothetical protein